MQLPRVQEMTDKSSIRRLFVNLGVQIKCHFGRMPFVLTKGGKLSLRFLGSFEVVQRVSPVVYKRELPIGLDNVHITSHVSMFEKFLDDVPATIVPIKDVPNNDGLHIIVESLRS